MRLPRERFPNLFETLVRFNASHVGDIRGTIVVDSGRSGPTVGITACTHGNEPCGLALFEHLLGEYKLAERLKAGKVCLVVNNIDAALSYFRGEPPGERNLYRYVDVNMNRLPERLDSSLHSGLEIGRARALLPIWQSFNAALDFHSTSKHSPPMLISSGLHVHTGLVKGFPVTKVLTNIDVVQLNRPAFGFYGGGTGSETPVMELEAGQHEEATTHTVAIVSGIAFLNNLALVEGSSMSSTNVYEEYRIFRSVVFPNESYRLTRSFKDFELVGPGTIFARGDGADFSTDVLCHTLFGPSPERYRDWASIAEEALFLSEPVRELVV